MASRSEDWDAGYCVGYREGGSSRDADYWFALDDALVGRPEWDADSDMSPQRVVELVLSLLPAEQRP